MADTVKIDLVKDTWQEIAADGTTGFFSNIGPVPIQYAEAAAAPTTNLGHGLGNDSDGMNFTLTAGQKLYARASSKDGAVSVTLA